MEKDLDEVLLDRSHFSVARLTDPDDSLGYWLSRPVVERLQALERLRRISYGNDVACARLQRVIEVAQLKSIPWGSKRGGYSARKVRLPKDQP